MPTQEIIRHRFTDAVLFSAELSAEYDGASSSVRLGAAVKLAVKAGADLAGAYLARANLADANLVGANLADANLASADLARANLAGAYLARAYLAHANLAGANLAGAYLADANLAGANLAGAKDVIDAGTPDGWRCVGWRRDGVARVRVGCRNKTLTEAREYWRGKDNRREVMAALDYVEVVARARGWIVTNAKESV